MRLFPKFISRSFIWIFIVSSTLSACFSLKEITIINKCSDPIEVGIRCDESLLDFYSTKKESQINCIQKMSLKSGADLIDIDTSNLFIHYFLPIGDSLILKLAKGNVFIFDSLTFSKNMDSITFGESDIYTIFLNEANELVDFEVKELYFELE
ncbi:hypothetical protein R9208_08670 [Flammeovirgaceae bacterium SG7u.132]|nr:hypothetical protein [Flammeovirgaceae bacterium SG7u.132]